MRKKFIKKEEYRNIIKPDEELVFGDTSPVSSITLPTRAISAIHGNVFVTGAQGTMYVIRKKDDFFKMNEYVFNSNREDDLEIRGPLKPKDHWPKEIPRILKDGYEKWLRSNESD